MICHKVFAQKVPRTLHYQYLPSQALILAHRGHVGPIFSRANRPQAHLALLGTGFSGSATAQTMWSVLTGITSTAWTMCMSMIMSFSPMKVALNFNNCLMVCRSKSGGEYILSFGLDGMPMKDKKVSYTFVQCLIPLGYHQE